ncbi:MAG: Integral membrane protein, partial [uncultured Propionibacteriaceae bacterium]
WLTGARKPIQDQVVSWSPSTGCSPWRPRPGLACSSLPGSLRRRWRTCCPPWPEWSTSSPLSRWRAAPGGPAGWPGWRSWLSSPESWRSVPGACSIPKPSHAPRCGPATAAGTGTCRWCCRYSGCSGCRGPAPPTTPVPEPP